MLQARNIWDLIVARADETPDREMAVDETGRRLTFGEYRDRCERAAAGLAALGVGDGTVVSWVQPTTLEAMVLFGALRRLGAVQNPILPIYREREVGFIVRQAGSSLLVVPSTWKGLRLRGDGRRRHRRHRRPRCWSATARCPTATRRRCRRPPDDDMHVPDRRAVPVRFLYYTSGTTAEPKGARHGDRSLHVGVGRHVRAAGPGRRRPLRPRVPVHPHRRGRLHLRGRRPTG